MTETSGSAVSMQVRRVGVELSGPLLEKRFDLPQEGGQLRLENIPDDSIVNIGVAVD